MQQANRARVYDVLSRWYSLLSDPSEGPLRRECLGRLCLQPGDAVLEIGSGPGTDLPVMAARVGSTGVVWGLDLSRGMLRVCQRSLLRDRRGSSICLIQGDGLQLPFRACAFDVVLLSFSLELFGESEIPQVLQEVGRVMRGEGRLGIVSLSNQHPGELATRVYWRAHQALPAVIDCRPINAPAIVAANGYELVQDVERSMWGLRVCVVVARRR